MEAPQEFAQRHGKIQSSGIFFVLCFFTFGIYAVWWNYKAWRFLQEKEDLDIYPAVRALFSIFFIHNLLEKIDSMAQEKGHKGINDSTNATLYIIALIVANLVSRLPEPYWLASSLIPFYAFLVPSVQQLNHYWEAEASSPVSRKMSFGEIIAVIVGALFLGIILLGLFLPT